MNSRSGVGFLFLSVCFLTASGCQPKKPSDESQQKQVIVNNSTASPGGLDVNDVSFLFPLPEQKELQSNYLSLSSKGFSGQPLLPKEIFDQIKDMAVKNGIAMDTIGLMGTRPRAAGTYENWKILGFRFDPCSDRKDHLKLAEANAAITSLSSCRTELRLIVQPVVFVPSPDPIRENDPFRTRNSTEDLTMHLIYTLQDSERLEGIKKIANDLLTLKAKAASLTPAVDTNYKPLGVHPALAQENMASGAPFTESLRKTILAHMDFSRLESVAFMGIDAADPWTFFATKINDDRKTIRALQVVGKSLTHKMKANDPVFIPPPEVAIEAMTITKQMREFDVLEAANTVHTEVGSRRPDLSKPPMKPHIDNMISDAQPREAALRVLNPSLFTQLEGDCVSCHIATSVTVNMEKRLLQGQHNFPDRFISPDGVTGFAASGILSNGTYVIRNFGYFRSGPRISLRSVNESAVVAKLLNRLVLNRPDPSPRKPECKTSELEWCIFNGGGNACFSKFSCR